jgi:hypothetical protein
VVVRHLNGKTAARPQEVGEPGKKRRMVRHPLQDSVGEDQVEAVLRLPRRHITQFEVQTGQAFLRLRDHPGGAFEAAHLSHREPVSNEFRAVAGSTADVNTALGGDEGHTAQEFDGRPRPLVLELEVLVRIPIGHPLIPPHPFEDRS